MWLRELGAKHRRSLLTSAVSIVHSKQRALHCIALHYLA
jgi:hypothetical protein